MKLWGGRFQDEPAPELLAFTESLSFDRALAREDCAVLTAHVRALARAGVLEAEAAESIATCLAEIAGEIERGVFAFEASDEDVHTAVERALIERLPLEGPRARAGLSRNDRVVTALRLWLLRSGHGLVLQLADLIATLAARADEHRDTLLPGYTHLQRAQPVTLAHHLLAHAFALVRDAQRMRDALDRTDASALGAGALAGSTLALDPEGSARELGFSRTLENSLDAVSARDFVAEFLAACAICAVHCSRLGEELVLWSSAEFGFAHLADAYTTGSSLMPQKKNPDVAELARGKAGRVIGDLTGLLATLKGLPLSYNRDLQEDKEPLFDAVRTLRAMLAALNGTMQTIRFDEVAMARAAADGGLLATDLAEYLVARGVAFREAHEIVGRLVREALAQQRDLTAFSLEDLRRFSVVFDAEVRDVLDVRASVSRRGAPGPAGVDAQRKAIDEALSGLRSSTTGRAP